MQTAEQHRTYSINDISYNDLIDKGFSIRYVAFEQTFLYGKVALYLRKIK